VLPTALGVLGEYSGSLLQFEPTYGFEFPAGQPVNFIRDSADARYTVYQKATLAVEYTEVPAVPVDTVAEFQLELVGQPSLQEIQNRFLDPGTRPVGADYLVKAAIPCFVSMSIYLEKENPFDTYESLGLAGLKKDLFGYVNTLGFEEEIKASKIIELCHRYRIKRVSLPITISGRILASSGEIISISSNDNLAIPYLPQKMVTAKTTVFIVDYFETSGVDNIGISFV
jgi:hypothetical protein